MKYYFRALGKYAEHDGRATRREFILYYVFHYLFVFVFSVLDGVLGLYPEDFILDYGVLTLLYLIATACPRICLSVRRLHDVGASGKWWWASNVPILSFYVIYMYLKRGDWTSNEYGEPANQDASSAKSKNHNKAASNRNLKKMYKRLNPELKVVVFPRGENEFIYVGTMLNHKFPGTDLLKLFQIYASVYSYYGSSEGNVAKTYDYATRKSVGVLTDDEALTLLSIVAVSKKALQSYIADPIAAVEQYKEYAINHVHTVAPAQVNPIPAPKILFCRACGEKLIGGSKFCHKCGTEVRSGNC